MTDNIFQYLGLPENHRKPDKVTMKVKHIDEVLDSKKTWPMYGQIKKDGVYALVVVRCLGTVGIFSRTGKKYTNVEGLEKTAEWCYLPQGVYIAELCNDLCSLETLSGIVNPNRKKDLNEDQLYYNVSTYLSFHDYLQVQEFIAGESALWYSNRYYDLQRYLPKHYDLIPYQIINNRNEMEAFTRLCIFDDEEGAVFKQPEEGWVAGHKGYRIMKKVRGVDYDLRCTGVEEGKGKYKGLVANLFFKWKDGKEIKCMLGKGWTHEMAREMWEDHTSYKHWHISGDTPVGKIFQVYALMESSKGKLRLPKVGELRIDKTEPDL